MRKSEKGCLSHREKDSVETVTEEYTVMTTVKKANRIPMSEEEI